MKWQKLGLIYAPRGEAWWAKAYAFLPTATVVAGKVIRVFFSSLDEDQYGRVGYVDLDSDDPRKALFETPEPVLDLGELGSFDDSGVNASSVVTLPGGLQYMYYIGWQRCERVPYMLFSGLAISLDRGETFRRYSRTPILDRTSEEPFARSAPFVLIEGGLFRMWYWSATGWFHRAGKLHYRGVIRHATSTDGLRWETDSRVCIEPDSVDEYAVGRPHVIHGQNVFQMWYSVRSFNRRYTLGYAESGDGITWDRKDDHAGIEKSTSGWDSEMICHPSIVDVKGCRYLFYNGNRHGSTGFGCAVLEL